MQDSPNPSQKPSKEQRAYKRFLIQLPVEYKLADHQDDLTQASILDISANGLRMRIKDKPSVSEEVHLKINLPNDGQIFLAAKVVWFKYVQDIQQYDTGLKIANTKSEDGKKFFDFYTQEMLTFLDQNPDSIEV